MRYVPDLFFKNRGAELGSGNIRLDVRGIEYRNRTFPPRCDISSSLCIMGGGGGKINKPKAAVR